MQRGIGWSASVAEAAELALLHLRLDSHSSWAAEVVEPELRRRRQGKHLVSEAGVEALERLRPRPNWSWTNSWVAAEGELELLHPQRED